MTDTIRRERPPFAQVPEAMLFADVSGLSDRAVRLYGVLDRYAGSNDTAWPARETLATRLACSVDTVDRAVRELEASGWLEVERRADARAVNRYTLRMRPRAKPSTGSRTGAATGSRTGAASVAARVRHERELGTRTTAAAADLVERNARRAAGTACPQCDDTTQVLGDDNLARPCDCTA